jgi:hypothetical protein
MYTNTQTGKILFIEYAAINEETIVGREVLPHFSISATRPHFSNTTPEASRHIYKDADKRN